MRHTRGFTLLEIAVALTIALVLIGAVYSVTQEATETAHLGTSISMLDAEVSRTLDRMATELVAAGIESIEPAALEGDPAVCFRKCIGADGTTIRWGPRQSFDLRAEDGVNRVVWVQDVDAESPREIVLTRVARAYAEGEVLNAADDNGNGLVDERGLSFELVGRTLTIRLTLERPGPAGQVLARTATTSVKLRN
jgi:prepilin-type N-terminal cleavage/methylation domain-containing protein